MLIKFFKNGQGGGAGPVDYLVEREVVAYDGNRNALRDNDGNVLMFEREPLPEVLRGDPDRMKHLIDACEHQWSYRAGVLSFATEDAPTPEQQRIVMGAFEELAFAGLEPDQSDILWVRHSHEDRVELHFVTPRMELATGRSLNIAPPGYQKTYDALRDVLNKHHGWSDPLAPERAREVKSLIECVKRGEGREQIHDWILDRIETGEIQNRTGMQDALSKAGFEIPRAGKNYITVRDPASDERWRLKGDIFREDWTRENALEKEVDRALERSGREPSRSGSRLDGIALETLRERLHEITQQRASYNRERYPVFVEPQRTVEQERQADHLHHNLDGDSRHLAEFDQQLVIRKRNDRQGAKLQSLANGIDDQSNKQWQSADMGREQSSSDRVSFWQRTRAVFANHRKEIGDGIKRNETRPIPDTLGARIDRICRTVGDSLRNIERSVQNLGSQISEDDLRETGKNRNFSGLIDRVTGLISGGLEQLRQKYGQEHQVTEQVRGEQEGGTVRTGNHEKRDTDRLLAKAERILSVAPAIQQKSQERSR